MSIGIANAISIRGCEKSFGATRAVRGLDLDVPVGSLCGFLGPNGAGKSTTIRMIMSIIYPDAGSVDVLGSSALVNKDRIGYLPEERGLYRKMRVGEYLQYIATLKGVGAGAAGKVTEWLDRIELPGVARKKCQELSKGMQQKVQFLAAIIHDPDLVILDEPFSGLDPVNAQLLNRLIVELKEQGKTIIFSTHVLHQAEQICDRIFLIHRGEKLLDDTMAQIHERFDPRTVLVEPLEPLPPTDSGLDSFGDLEGVAHVQRLDGRNEFELEIDDDMDPQHVLRGVLQRMPVRSARLRRLSLDEVFIRLVAEESGEEAAAQAREELSHA